MSYPIDSQKISLPKISSQCGLNSAAKLQTEVRTTNSYLKQYLFIKKHYGWQIR
jgi:hypothetical protein